MTQLAPIVLFVYNRPWHTQQTVEALQKNELAGRSDLIIFSDGAKADGRGRRAEDGGQRTEVRGQKSVSESQGAGGQMTEDRRQRSEIRDQRFENSTTDNRSPITDHRIQEVRDYIRTIDGFKSVRIVERTENMGLASSIIAGVTETIEKNGKIIVLEDDMVTSPYFLKYMNDALDLYETEEKVISIHAYIYPFTEEFPETFFLKGTQCWGWATWEKEWSYFESDGEKLLTGLNQQKLQKRFDYNGTYPCLNMLKNQIKGKSNSWAIRWYASALLLDKLTLYPRKSLIRNIGTDGSGIHNDETNAFNSELNQTPIDVQYIEMEENMQAYKIFCDFYHVLMKNEFNIIKRISRKINRIFN